MRSPQYNQRCSYRRWSDGEKSDYYYLHKFLHHCMCCGFVYKFLGVQERNGERTRNRGRSTSEASRITVRLLICFSTARLRKCIRYCFLAPKDVYKRDVLIDRYQHIDFGYRNTYHDLDVCHFLKILFLVIGQIGQSHLIC